MSSIFFFLIKSLLFSFREQLYFTFGIYGWGKAAITFPSHRERAFHMPDHSDLFRNKHVSQATPVRLNLGSFLELLGSNQSHFTVIANLGFLIVIFALEGGEPA